MEAIKLDLIPGKQPPSVNASQFDIGRQIRFNLYEGATAYELTGDEVITVTVRKPDGTVCEYEVDNTADKYVIIETTEQMCAVSGIACGEITIKYSDASVSTANFNLVIEQSPSAGGITSESDIENLETQIEQIVSDKSYTRAEVDAIAEEIREEIPSTDTFATVELVNSEIERVEGLIPDVSGFATKTELNTGLEEKADKSSVYTKSESDTITDAIRSAIPDVSGLATKTELTTGLNSKADKSNTYTKNEVDVALSSKADASDIPDMTDYYTKTATDSLLSNKADTTALEDKADKSTTYTKTEVDNLLDDKADKSTTYTKTEVDTALAGKADVTNTYTKSEVDTALNGKAKSSSIADLTGFAYISSSGSIYRRFYDNKWYVKSLDSVATMRYGAAKVGGYAWSVVLQAMPSNKRGTSPDGTTDCAIFSDGDVLYYDYNDGAFKYASWFSGSLLNIPSNATILYSMFGKMSYGALFEYQIYKDVQKNPSNTIVTASDDYLINIYVSGVGRYFKSRSAVRLYKPLLGTEMSDAYMGYTWATIISNFPSKVATAPDGTTDCLLLNNEGLYYDWAGKKWGIATITNIPTTATIVLASLGQCACGALVDYNNRMGFEWQKETLPQYSLDSLKRYTSKLIGASDNISRFGMFTDPHIFDYAYPEKFDVLHQHLEKISKIFNDSPIDSSVCCGDWLNSGTTPAQAAAQLGYATRYCETNLPRFYNVIGNHDTNVLGTQEFSKTQASNIIYGSNSGKCYLSYEVQGKNFVILNSWSDETSTSMDSEKWAQIDWLAEEIKNQKDVIIFMHCIWVNGSSRTVSEFANNVTLLCKALNDKSTVTLNGQTYDFSNATGGVFAVIGGHRHEFYSGTVNGIACVILDNSTDYQSHMFDEVAPCAYLVCADYGNRLLHFVCGLGASSDHTVSV